LALSEILTIIVYFHRSHYRDCKHYSTAYVAEHLRCGADAPGRGALVRLSAHPERPLHGHHLCRFDSPRGVSQPAHQPPRGALGRSSLIG
jgi:hypothetical protein